MQDPIHDLDATPLSRKAILFRHETNRSKRDKLFLEICDHYLPKVYKMLASIQYYPCDKEEYIHIYRIEVYAALLKWNLKSNFNTYVYNYILSVPRKFKKTKELIRKEIKSIVITDMTDEDHDYASYTLFDEDINLEGQ